MTTTVVSCVYSEYLHHYNNNMLHIVLIYIIYHVIFYIMLLLYHGKGVVRVTLKTSYFTRERNDIA